MRLVVSPRAVRDLHDISAHIRRHDAKAALRVRAAILDALQVIAVYPRAGRLLHGGVRKYVLTRFPYLIFYQVDEDHAVIGVATIRHAAREP